MLLTVEHCRNRSLFWAPPPPHCPFLHQLRWIHTCMQKLWRHSNWLMLFPLQCMGYFYETTDIFTLGYKCEIMKKVPNIKCFCDIQITCSQVNGKYVHISWPDITCTVDPQSPSGHMDTCCLATMNNFLMSQQNSHIRIIIILTDSLSVVLSNLDAVQRWRPESFYNISYCTLQIIIIWSVSSVIIMVKWHHVADLSLKWTRF